MLAQQLGLRRGSNVGTPVKLFQTASSVPNNGVLNCDDAESVFWMH